MLADTFLLLHLYWTIDRRADSGTKCSTRVIMIIGAVFIVVMSIALGAFAGSLTRDNSIIQIKAEILPGLLFTIVLFGIVFVVIYYLGLVGFLIFKKKQNAIQY